MVPTSERLHPHTALLTTSECMQAWTCGAALQPARCPWCSRACQQHPCHLERHRASGRERGFP